MKKSISLALSTTFILTSFVVVFLTLINNCQAETTRSFKVVTVDIAKVINGLDESKTKKNELKKMKEKAENKIKAKRDGLKNLESRIKKLNPLEDSGEVIKLRKEVREFERLMKDEEEELKRKYIQVNRELAGKAIGAVREYAAKNKIDLVIEKGEAMRSPILYRHSDLDITAKVIAMLN